MSQTGSSSGVRVATQPLSNVYTVLLLIGALALVLALVFLCIVMDRNYDVILALTEEGQANKALPEKTAEEQETRREELEEADRSLKRFPEEISASAPTAPSKEGEATETDESGELFPEVDSE